MSAANAYARNMGFSVDWTYEDHLAGISKDAARVLFTAQDLDGNGLRVFFDLGSGRTEDPS
jgi:hypothetical protein